MHSFGVDTMSSYLAHSSGVCPSLSRVEGCAPLATSSSTCMSWPAWAATCRGVFPRSYATHTYYKSCDSHVTTLMSMSEFLWSTSTELEGAICPHCVMYIGSWEHSPVQCCDNARLRGLKKSLYTNVHILERFGRALHYHQTTCKTKVSSLCVSMTTELLC